MVESLPERSEEVDRIGGGTAQFDLYAGTCIILFPETDDESGCCELVPSRLDAGVLQVLGKLGIDEGLII